MINENRFYVYQHRLVKDDSVFYVGNGTGSRKTIQDGRNKKWKEIVKDNEWYALIVKGNLTKAEAEELEINIISVCKPIANVRTTSIATKALNTEYIDSTLCYDETSPSFLRYKIHNGQSGSKQRKIGDVAGCLANFLNCQRYVVGVGGSTRLSHRVVWYLCTGEDPVGFLIDHIDGNTLNNNITNLRKVCHLENARNTKMSSRNVSGYKGVSKYKTSFSANWYESLVPKSKSFGTTTYGKELALALAIEYRYRMVIKQAELGNPLSDRHTGTHKTHPLLVGISESEIQSLFKRPPTKDCTTGLRIKDAKNGTVITPRKIIGDSEYTKSFNAKKLGLLESIALAIRWRDSFKG